MNPLSLLFPTRIKILKPVQAKQLQAILAKTFRIARFVGWKRRMLVMNSWSEFETHSRDPFTLELTSTLKVWKSGHTCSSLLDALP